MTFRRRMLVGPLVLGLMSGTPLAVLAGPEASVQPRQAGHFFGVMGHVVRPGVYEYRHAYPQLAEVLWHAGGLSPTASHNIRVVRDGENGRQVFYSPAGTFRLWPGDIVIADGLPRPPRPVAPSAQRAAPVQVGCVGLLERPVVLQVPRDQATVEGIVASLGQSREAAGRVRILQTSGESVDATGLAGEKTLPDGAVLVFDPATVRIEQLPDLPNTYRIDVQAAAPAPQPFQRQTVSPDAARMALQGAQPLPELMPAPQTMEQAALDMPLSAERPVDDLASVFSEAEAGAAAQTSSRTNPSAAATPPREPAKTPAPAPTAPEAAVKDDAATDWTMVGLLAGSLAAAVGAALALVRRRKSQGDPNIIRFPAAKPEPPPPARKNRLGLLDALINDELPLTEETCELPTGLQFYGRSAGARHLRIQPGHETLSGPHFAPRGAAEGRPDAEAIRLRTDRAHEDDDGDAAGLPLTAGLTDGEPADDRRASILDRVLSHIHTAGKPA